MYQFRGSRKAEKKHNQASPRLIDIFDDLRRGREQKVNEDYRKRMLFSCHAGQMC